MQQAILGWVLVTLGTGLVLRVLFRRNDSFGGVVAWLSVGAGAMITGLWLVHILDLPDTIHRVFASI